MEQEKKDPKMSSLTDTKLIVPFLSHFKTNMLMHEVPREQWSTLLLPTLDHTSTELLYSILCLKDNGRTLIKSPKLSELHGISLDSHRIE